MNLRKAFLLCVALFMLLMALAVLLAGRPEGGAPKRLWKSRALALGLAVVSTAAILMTHNALLPKEDSMWWGNTYNPNAETEVYKQFTNTNRSMMLTGMYQYTLRNLAVTMGWGEDRQSAEQLDLYYQDRQTAVSYGSTGALKGKNLIMVMLESADTWLAVPEYMPNLSALREKSVDFTRFYTPLFLSAGTFNTEIISQTGLIPAASGLSSSAYSTNSFPLSLAHLFAEEGYTVNSFHSASPSIYSRGSVHENLGFEAYHNYVDMGMDDYQLDSQMIRAYDQFAPQGKFFTYIITYSGHGPYTDELKNISDPHLEAAKAAVAESGVTGSAENMSEYTLAVAHAMETDAFIGQLIDRLEQDGRLEDTALLFYADHYGKYMTDKEFLNKLKGVGDDPNELYRTPCFLYSAGLEAKKVEKYCSSIDLVPTLVDLFYLPANLGYYVGEPILGPWGSGGFVMMPDGSWFGDPGGRSEEEMLIEVKQRLTVSTDTLKCDYFKGWKAEGAGRRAP